MRILTAIAEAQNHGKKGPRVLVPTMGALHKAHGELIRVAREQAERFDWPTAVDGFLSAHQIRPSRHDGSAGMPPSALVRW